MTNSTRHLFQESRIKVDCNFLTYSEFLFSLEALRIFGEFLSLSPSVYSLSFAFARWRKFWIANFLTFRGHRWRNFEFEGAKILSGRRNLLDRVKLQFSIDDEEVDVHFCLFKNNTSKLQICSLFESPMIQSFCQSPTAKTLYGWNFRESLRFETLWRGYFPREFSEGWRRI